MDGKYQQSDFPFIHNMTIVGSLGRRVRESLSGRISAPSASKAVRTRSLTFGGNTKSVTACQKFQ